MAHAQPTVPFFPRGNPLLILPSTPVDIITELQGQPSFGGSGSGSSVQKSVRRRYTLRLLSSSQDGKDDSPQTSKGRGLRFEMTDEGDGGQAGDDSDLPTDEDLETPLSSPPAEPEADSGEPSVDPTGLSGPSQPASSEITLYSLEVYEDDFHLLKASQSLLVDFEQFPRMLESLLKGCNTGHYQCRLTESGPSCTLQIVEPSTFKELTHLRLTIVKNTDREIRPYLSNRVNELTNGVRALRSHAGKALGQRDLAMAEVARLKSEVGRLELEKEAVARTVRLEMSEKLREGEAEAQRRAKEQVSQAKREFEEKERLARAEVAKANDRLDAAAAERDKSVSDRYELESAVRSLRMDLKGRTETCEKLKEDLAEAQRRLTEVEGERFQSEREVHRLELHVASLEQSSKGVADIEANYEMQRQEWQDAKAMLNSQNSLLAGKNDALEAKVKRAGREIEKGNEIIERLQSEYRLCKSKLKSKTSSLRSLEVGKAEADDELGRSRRRLAEVEASHGRLKETHAALLSEHEAAKDKLAESNTLLASNHQVITWLNKEVNAAQLGRVSAYSGESDARIEDKYVPSYTPEMKAGRGLGAYISPDGGQV